MSDRRAVLSLVGALVVLGAAAVVVWSVATTSSARVSASTGGEGFFSAGTVELTRHDSSVSLRIDADGLFPGAVVPGCLAVDYTGSIPAEIRLHGARTGGTGLARYVELRLRLRRSGSCDEAGTGAATVFSGGLAELWTAHPTYADGLDLGSVVPGDRLVLEADLWLVDDDDAQGRTTEFLITVEARP